MNSFGCQEDFAIEVGDCVDHTGHCRLDFYACGIHLNQADNSGFLVTVLHHWPRDLFSSEDWTHADIYWEVPFSTQPEVLLEKVVADHALFRKHTAFGLGPVTDSFSLLVFARPTDFVLLLIRNDGFGCKEGDLSNWKGVKLENAATTHWQSVVLARQEFKHICESAHACLSALTRV